MKNKLLLGLFVGAILVSLAFNIFYSEKVFAQGNGGYSHETTLGYEQFNWMASLPDNSKLSTLSLPGTHDTMALYWGDLAQTQSMLLNTQLNSGIRVLDIRCKHINNSFLIYHNFTYQYANFDDVLRTVTNFLQNHPTETVLLMVGKEGEEKETNTNTFEQTYQAYKSPYTSYFWVPKEPDSLNPLLNPLNPTLGEVRGKIVVLYNGSDFGKASDFGQYPKYKSDVGINFQNKDLFKKLDYQPLKTNWDLYDKWIAVKNHINAASAGNPEHFYVNYLSGSSEIGSVFPYFVASGNINGGTFASNLSTGIVVNISDAQQNAKWPDFPRDLCAGIICSIFYEGTNVLTYERLVNKHLRVGIIMADFPGAGLIDRIIKQNNCSS